MKTAFVVISHSLAIAGAVYYIYLILPTQEFWKLRQFHAGLIFFVPITIHFLLRLRGKLRKP